MTSWTKSQFKHDHEQLPRNGGGNKWKWRSPKRIKTKAEDEEYEKELKEFVNGSNFTRTKTKTN